MRTPEEIALMIAQLEALKSQVPPRTILDEYTTDAIDVQIAVLQNNFDQDTVWNMWPAGNDDVYYRECAMIAVKWLEGEGDPALNWQKLIKGEQL